MFVLRKKPLACKQEGVQRFKRNFEFNLFFEQGQLYCLEGKLFLHADLWKCKK